MTTFHPPQSLLKRTGLLATLTLAIATALSCINVRSVQAQTARRPQLKLAPVAEITFVRAPTGVIPNEPFQNAAICPQGTLAIGGGGEMSPKAVNDAFIKDSYSRNISNSDPYPRAWVMTTINLSGQPVSFSSYAICVQVTN